MAEAAKSNHAVLSPSGFKRIMECPGSLWLGRDIPDPPTSKYAAEGTLAHFLIEECLTDTDQPEWVIEKYEKKSIEAGAEVDINDGLYGGEYPSDMADCVLGCVSYIDGLCQKLKPHTKVVEKKVRLTKNIWGTVDFGLAYKNKKKQDCLAVVDYKHGKGVSVQAQDNPQLLIYGLALARELRVDPEYLTCVIYQPRVEGEEAKRIARYDREALVDWTTRIKKSARLAMSVKKGSKQPIYKAGEHCKFCKAKGICKAYQQSANAIGMLDDLEVLPSVAQLSDEQLIDILQRRKLIEEFLNAVSEYAYTRAEDGKPIAGTKLVEGRSQRRWAGKAEELGPKIIRLGVDDPYDKKLKGIGKIEKEISEKLFESDPETYGTKVSQKAKASQLLSELTEKPAGKISIALENDPRPAVSGGKVTLLEDLPTK